MVMVSFALVYMTEKNFQIQAPGGIYYRRYFCVLDGRGGGGIGAYTRRGLYTEGLIFGIFRYT